MNEQVEKIKRELERRLKSGCANHYEYTAYKSILSFIDSLEEKPVVGYDPEYLQSCIDKTTADGSWKGVDIDEYMYDVRGKEDKHYYAWLDLESASQEKDK